MVEVILATQEAEVRGDFRESETSPSDSDVFNKRMQVGTLERKQCGVLWCLAGMAGL